MANPTGLAWEKNCLKKAETTLAHGTKAKKTKTATTFQQPTKTHVTQ